MDDLRCADAALITADGKAIPCSAFIATRDFPVLREILDFDGKPDHFFVPVEGEEWHARLEKLVRRTHSRHDEETVITAEDALDVYIAADMLGAVDVANTHLMLAWTLAQDQNASGVFEDHFLALLSHDDISLHVAKAVSRWFPLWKHAEAYLTHVGSFSHDDVGALLRLMLYYPPSAVGAWLFDASPKFRADAADSTNVLRILTGYSTRFTPLEFRALVRRAEAVLHMANPWPQPKADVTDAVLKLMAAFTVANGKTYGVPKRTPRSPDIGFHVDIDSPHGDEWLFTAEFAPRAKRGKPVLMSEKLEVTLFDWSAGQTPLTFRVRGHWARRAVVHVTVGVDWTLSNALYEARFEKIGPHEGWASYESFAKVASYHSPAYAHHLGRKLVVRLDFWGDCELPKLNVDV